MNILRYISLKKAWNAFLLRISYAFHSEDIHKWCKPTFLNIEVSSICNLKCPQCAVGMNSIHRNNAIELSTMKSIVDECKNSLFTIQLYFQGEPLLNKQLPEMVRYAHEKNIYTLISTNGQLLTKNIATKLVEAGLDHIIISIDGINQESYEKYRVGGSLSKAIDSVKYLKEIKNNLNKNLRIVVQMIVFSHNENEIDDMKRLGIEWGADAVDIKSAQIYDLPQNANLIPKNERFSRYIKKNGEWVLKKKIRNHCWRNWSGAVIDSEGNILPCCFDKIGRYCYGNVKDGSIKNIWNNTKAHLFRNKIAKNRKDIDICNNCTE